MENSMTPFAYAFRMFSRYCSKSRMQLIEAHHLSFEVPGKIYVPRLVAQVRSVENVASICHEVGHVVQYERWPWLFKIRAATRRLVLGYFINLFLEWHASRLAYRFLISTNHFEATELATIKYFYLKTFKTYL